MLKDKTLGVVARTLDFPAAPFGKNTFFFEEMMQSKENLPIDVFFFSPEAWNRNADTVKGYVFHENQWITACQEIPKVIYDRYISRPNENEQKIRELRLFLSQKKHRFTTNIRLVKLVQNKIKFHEFLHQNQLPTISGTTLHDLSEQAFFDYFSHTQAVVVKPIFGYRGENIDKIEACNNKFILKTKHDTRQFSANEIFPFVKRSYDNGAFFVQAMANALTINNAPFNLKILVQNSGNKNYQLTGQVVRVGQEGRWVSNANASGLPGLELESLKTLCEEHSAFSLSEIKKQIQDICLKTAHLLHDEFGDFCELSFDLLLTKDKGAVMLEANSKPSRWVFNAMVKQYKPKSEKWKYFKNLRYKSVRYPLLFAVNQNW